MFRSIVVGTDGSDTAKEAVRQAVDLAKQLGARLELVSAYEPVSQSRLREETRDLHHEYQHYADLLYLPPPHGLGEAPTEGDHAPR